MKKLFFLRVVLASPWCVALLFIMALVNVQAGARPGVGVPGAGVLVASSTQGIETHGWGVYKNVQGEILLVHIPPRNLVGHDAKAITPALPGEVHAVRSLNEFPQGLAGDGRRVYMIFPQVYVNKRKLRRVYSGRAEPLAVGGSWGFGPTGRLDAIQSIETQGELVAFTATTRVLWALFEQEDAQKDTQKNARYTLFGLIDSKWRVVDLPAGDGEGEPTKATKRASKWSLIGDGDQLLAVDRTDADAIRVYGLSDDADTEMSWRALDWPSVALIDPQAQILAGEHGLVIVESVDGEGDRVRSWSGDGVFTLIEKLDVPQNTVFTVLGSVNRLVGITQARQGDQADEQTDDQADSQADSQTGDSAGDPSSEQAQAIGEATVQIHEIDLSDGSALYSAGPFVSPPVSAAEFRFLLGMMILVMVGVLVVVILPEKADALAIPDGYELADPGRRFSASILDAFLIASLMGQLFGVRVIDIITLNVVTQSENSWLVIPAIIVCGLVSMSLFEWLLGATPGKFLVGIRVVRAQGGASRRVSLGGALIRNVIKWVLPPVAALALVDPEMLHRGDRVSHSIVVSAVPSDTQRHDEPQD